MFNYEITRVDENTVKYTTEDGSNVTLRFRKEDNPDIEDIITEKPIVIIWTENKRKCFATITFLSYKKNIDKITLHLYVYMIQ